MATAILESKPFSTADEPSLALAGFDDPAPRRLLEQANFDFIVDAGLGGGVGAAQSTIRETTEWLMPARCPSSFRESPSSSRRAITRRPMEWCKLAPLTTWAAFGPYEIETEWSLRS
jgi:hypothetical protein